LPTGDAPGRGGGAAGHGLTELALEGNLLSAGSGWREPLR
jgi:hypothetical protein